MRLGSAWKPDISIIIINMVNPAQIYIYSFRIIYKKQTEALSYSGQSVESQTEMVVKICA